MQQGWHLMKRYVKGEFPVDDVRRFLEPGPVVLVSSAWKGETDIMTMGWHMIMGEDPSLVGCFIWGENRSFDIIRKSRECVINIPEVHLAKTTVEIGNCSGRDVDKFEEFDLTSVESQSINAPSIKECFANFECTLFDARLIDQYNLFIFEVVKAYAAKSPKFPKTLHYRGDGLFMISGETVSRYRKLFDPKML